MMSYFYGPSSTSQTFANSQPRLLGAVLTEQSVDVDEEIGKHDGNDRIDPLIDGMASVWLIKIRRKLRDPLSRLRFIIFTFLDARAI